MCLPTHKERKSSLNQITSLVPHAGRLSHHMPNWPITADEAARTAWRGTAVGRYSPTAGGAIAVDSWQPHALQLTSLSFRDAPPRGFRSLEPLHFPQTRTAKSARSRKVDSEPSKLPRRVATRLDRVTRPPGSHFGCSYSPYGRIYCPSGIAADYIDQTGNGMP